jgi:hypothetical protein
MEDGLDYGVSLLNIQQTYLFVVQPSFAPDRCECVGLLGSPLRDLDLTFTGAVARMY